MSVFSWQWLSRCSASSRHLVVLVHLRHLGHLVVLAHLGRLGDQGDQNQGDQEELVLVDQDLEDLEAQVDLEDLEAQENQEDQDQEGQDQEGQDQGDLGAQEGQGPQGLLQKLSSSLGPLLVDHLVPSLRCSVFCE